jgi:L-lactate dehydrogenase complex protein LldG
VTPRDQILARIEDALADISADELPDDAPVDRGYRRREPGDPVERFVTRVSEYRADVRRVRAADLAAAIGGACGERRIEQLAVPSDLPLDWIPDGVDAVSSDPLAPRELEALDAALTGCALGIAETGTIVLDAGSRQGRRALTLVPDHHFCVVEETQIVGGVPEAFARIAAAVRESRNPITLVSGPSATSDIELDRVEGVHGPRDLVVFVVA